MPRSAAAPSPIIRIIAIFLARKEASSSNKSSNDFRIHYSGYRWKRKRRSCVLRSNDVIFATRCKNIDYEGVFQGRGAVFDSTTDHETVTGSNVECFSLTSDFQMSANDVDNLVVGVAVGTACPTPGHLVLGEEEFVVVGHHLARETRFRF